MSSEDVLGCRHEHQLDWVFQEAEFYLGQAVLARAVSLDASVSVPSFLEFTLINTNLILRLGKR
ncbi:MAG: hypothetical protein ACKVG9_00765, partial [Rhodospirillales bacterium]